MPHPPRRIRFPQQYSALCVSHNAAPPELRQTVPFVRLISPRSYLALFKHRKRFLDGVHSSNPNPQVPSEEPLNPRSLLAGIRHEANADLCDRKRERVMHRAGPVAGFNSAIEKNVDLRCLELWRCHLKDSGLLRSLGPHQDLREHEFPDFLTNLVLLLEGICDLAIP